MMIGMVCVPFKLKRHDESRIVAHDNRLPETVELYQTVCTKQQEATIIAGRIMN